MPESRKTTSTQDTPPIRNVQTLKQHFELTINGRTIRSAETTQVAILEAAIEEFAANGFCGARVDTIALRAKTNKRMLYHYFDDKAGLYLAVLERVFEKLLIAGQDLRLISKEPVDGIRQLALSLWHYFLDHPEFVSILSTENKLKAEHLKKSPKVQLLNSHYVRELEEVLRRGVESGVFRPDVDPTMVHLTIVSMSFYCINNRHTILVNFDRDFSSPELIQSWGEHIARTTLASIMLTDRSSTPAECIFP